MDRVRELLGVSRGVTTFRSRALGALLFMAGLGAILAVTLARS